MDYLVPMTKLYQWSWVHCICPSSGLHITAKNDFSVGIKYCVPFESNSILIHARQLILSIFKVFHPYNFSVSCQTSTTKRDGGIKVKKKKKRYLFVDNTINEHISVCVPKQTPFHNTMETKHCLYFIACISGCIS